MTELVIAHDIDEANDLLAAGWVFVQLMPDLRFLLGRQQEQPVFDWTKRAAQWLKGLDPMTLEQSALANTDFGTSASAAMVAQLVEWLDGGR